MPDSTVIVAVGGDLKRSATHILGDLLACKKYPIDCPELSSGWNVN
jgi:hypothetical protein